MSSMTINSNEIILIKKCSYNNNINDRTLCGNNFCLLYINNIFILTYLLYKHNGCNNKIYKLITHNIMFVTVDDSRLKHDRYQKN